jgi:hypothetical protein
MVFLHHKIYFNYHADFPPDGLAEVKVAAHDQSPCRLKLGRGRTNRSFLVIFRSMYDV